MAESLVCLSMCLCLDVLISVTCYKRFAVALEDGSCYMCVVCLLSLSELCGVAELRSCGVAELYVC